MTIFEDAGNWVKGAVKTAGKAAGSVPIVGDGLKAVVDISLEPLALTGDIASGGRLDRVALRSLKRQVGSAKAIAPYAAAVVSFVPGVGTGVAAAIAAGAALAEGRPLDQAAIAGIKGAIPGGPVAQSAFSVCEAVADGKGLEQVGIAALPIPATQKQMISSTLKITKALIDGKKVDKTLINEAMKNLPSATIKVINKASDKLKLDVLSRELEKSLSPELRKAVQIGVAVAIAKDTQQKQKKKAKAAIIKLPFIGSKIVNGSISLKATASMLNKDERSGLDVGVGLMQHKITKSDFLNVRKALPGPERKGFDIAVSTHIGRVLTKDKPPPVVTETVSSWDKLAAEAKRQGKLAPPKMRKREMNPKEKAAYYATLGMKGATEEQKVGMLKSVATKETAPAIKAAIKVNNSVWKRILDYFGIV